MITFLDLPFNFDIIVNTISSELEIVNKLAMLQPQNFCSNRDVII